MEWESACAGSGSLAGGVLVPGIHICDSSTGSQNAPMKRNIRWENQEKRILTYFIKLKITFSAKKDYIIKLSSTPF